MEIVIVYDDGWACANNVKENKRVKGINEKGNMEIDLYLTFENMFVFSGEPKKDCQVLTDKGNGFFCIFESNEKLSIKSKMQEQEIHNLKNNLRKWQHKM